MVLLSTVLEEVKHRSMHLYKRLRELVNKAEKHFYVFTNEHHRETFVEKREGESPNDRNDRGAAVLALRVRC